MKITTLLVSTFLLFNLGHAQNKTTVDSISTEKFGKNQEETSLSKFSFEVMYAPIININKEFYSFNSGGAQINYFTTDSHSYSLEGIIFGRPIYYMDMFVKALSQGPKEIKPTPGGLVLLAKTTHYYYSDNLFKQGIQLGIGLGEITYVGKEVSRTTEEECSSVFLTSSCYETTKTITYATETEGPFALMLGINSKIYKESFGFGNETGILLIGTMPQFFSLFTLSLGHQ